MAEWPCCHDPLRSSPTSHGFVPPPHSAHASWPGGQWGGDSMRDHTGPRSRYAVRSPQCTRVQKVLTGRRSCKEHATYVYACAQVPQVRPAHVLFVLRPKNQICTSRLETSHFSKKFERAAMYNTCLSAPMQHRKKTSRHRCSGHLVRHRCNTENKTARQRCFRHLRRNRCSTAKKRSASEYG